MAILTLALLLAAGTTVSRNPVVPNAQRLVHWTPGPVRCGPTVIDPLRLARVRPELRYGDIGRRTVTLRFRIDDSGRPLSIRADRNDGDMGYYPHGDDLAPALAASRFAAGAPRSECAIGYTLDLIPFEAADPVELMAYSLDPVSGRLPREGWQRIIPEDTNCRRSPQPASLLRAFPDFRTIAGMPGERSWSMTGYDVDRKGRPINVRTIAGTGNTPLDVASRRAVTDSRFIAGARQGCLLPYRRAAERIVAPPAPEEARFGPTPNCPAAQWAQPPRLTYPPAWNRRKIEGWAVVQFDVAPWGEIGNTRVLASEPAEAFGQQAMQVVRSARRAASPTGASGCIERVRFAIRPAAASELGGEGAEPTD